MARRDARRIHLLGQGPALLHQPQAARRCRRFHRLFVGQGLSALGDRLGPINWQFMATKKFDADDMEAFLEPLPPEIDGGVLPPRPRKCATPASRMSASTSSPPRYNAGIVFADDDEFPRIEKLTTDFTCKVDANARDRWKQATPQLSSMSGPPRAGRAKRGDVFVLFHLGRQAARSAGHKCSIDASRSRSLNT